MISIVFSLPPDQSLYDYLKSLINPNGIVNVGAMISQIPSTSHGLVILTPSNSEDFAYYTLNNSTAACDSQYTLSGGPGPALRQSGTCISDKEVSFLVDCSNMTNSKGEKNWLYVVFNQTGTYFSTFGDAKAIFVPRSIGQPPPPPTATVGEVTGQQSTTSLNTTQNLTESSNQQLVSNIPTLNWTDHGYSSDENTIVLSDCPAFIPSSSIQQTTNTSSS